MSQDPRLPSAPALRLRRFLHERGLRLEPWASQEQILDTFLTHLAHEDHDDAYWEELTVLAAQLAADLRQRRPQSALTAAITVDTDELMREIRAGLGRARTKQGDFRSLGRMLPGPAMSLLLLVTLVAVGCGGQTDSDRSGVTTTQSGGNGGAATDAGGTGGASVSAGGTGGASVSSGGTGGASVSSGGIGGLPIIEISYGGTPSTGGTPGSGGAAGAPGCFPAEMTIRELLEACVEDTDARDAYLQALENSHPDWSQFIADYFRCRTCGEVASIVEMCTGYGWISPEVDPPDESPSIWDLCNPVLVYEGVRFT